MACEVNNKEINSQCAELLVRPTYNPSISNPSPTFKVHQDKNSSRISV